MQTLAAALERARARIHPNQDQADVAIGLGLAALTAATVLANGIRIDLLGAVLLALQTLPITVRRRDPIIVLCLTGGAITIYSVLGYPDANGSFGVFAAFYTVAANEPRERAMVAALITAGGITLTWASYAVFKTLASWTVGLTLNFVLFAFAWLVGDNLRVRRAYTHELEERAARLEREREEEATAAVGEERARIARELHDIVAHYVSVAVVQASGARRILDRDPESARTALEAVETAGRTALTEMRRMLEVLRADDSGLGPQPGLGDLDALVERVRRTGLPVELTMDGDVCCLPAGMDLAAYRIVQEALTNTVKHAGRAKAQVTIRFRPDDLEIEVIDDGRGAAAPLVATGGHGQGLVGMRERVALFGGTLEAGPRFPGGYRVFASLPMDPEETAQARRIEASRRVARGEREAARRDPGPGEGPHRKAPQVAPRVVPPLIGRVVPPRREPMPNPETSRRERGGEL
jgi:signal transduction histidine kinase